MAVKDRDYRKAPEAAPSAMAGWFARLNDYGERHATAIITISTALIILTVLIFAKYFYDRAQIDRAWNEIRDPPEFLTLDRLLEAKRKYGRTPVAPAIVYRLANKYYQEGKLEAAKNEYNEFRSRFPNDPLETQVAHALASLDKNLKFEQEQKERRLKELRLQSHPSQLAQLKDPRLQWGPVRQPNPVVELDAGTGLVRIELFEDEAPNAVAHFVKLCEEKEKYWEGVKFDLVNDGERLQTLPKADRPVDLTLALENSGRPADEYSLLLVKKEGAAENLGGQFQILLKALPDPKDVTVFGKVTEGMPRVRDIRKDAAIKSAKVVTKRDHPYEPQVIKKP